MSAKDITGTLRKKLGNTVFCNVPGVNNNFIPITNKIAFFPVGNGYITEKSNPDILVLGQDFGTFGYYASLKNNPTKQDTDCPTWKNMRELFRDAGLCENRCFFSNVFMGLRTGTSMKGTFPGYRDKNYREQSILFLKEQIKTVQPKVVITLGLIPAKMLMRADDAKPHLKKSLNEIQSVNRISVGGQSFYWVALVHPSMRRANVSGRYFNGFSGAAAEKEMLAYAL